MIAVGVFHHLARERRDQRQHQDGLRQHHGLEAEQPAQKTQRTGAREQQVDHQAHHHGGNGQKGVEEREHHGTPGEPDRRQPGAQQQPHAAGQQAGRGAHGEGAHDDGPEPGIARKNELQRGHHAVGKGVHSLRRSLRGRCGFGST